CFTPNIVKTEVISKIIRSGHNAENAVKIIKELSFTPVEEAETYFNAGKIHAEAKRTNPGMSPADAIILAIAESNKCTILTNDHHLKRTNTILLG
ncbi:MAG: PIN domain-containing protein, partial [Candidatus Diapherotrites archaeon]|nr:PIN domain-containing protein [Candidatus Diapherotrites archaeon]